MFFKFIDQPEMAFPGFNLRSIGIYFGAIIDLQGLYI
jgi:hypothetical protein